MDPAPEGTSPVPDSDSIAKATSELNNLLQVISGTSADLENAGEHAENSEKYRAVLRTSIERAEKIAAELARRAGGAKEKTMLAPELTPFAGQKKAPNSITNKQSILLVDDEEMILTMVKRILIEAGFNVATAHSGFECLDFVRQRPHQYDLVVLDFSMPFMDGEETFGRLRELRANLPVVLCTGFIQQEKLDRLMSIGLSGFLRKPISPDEIVNVVRSTLQTVRYSGGSVSPKGMSAAV